MDSDAPDKRKGLLVSRSAELKRMLDPARRTDESFKAYRERRRLAALSVARHLVGRLAYSDVKYGVVPDAGTDQQVDEQIRRGDLRVVGHKDRLYEIVRIDKPGLPVQLATQRMRVVRTKGKPYVKPKEEPKQ